ncbi:MAG: Fe-S cluster assembly ATPase SufC [Lactobacillales bacterium]|nr:Fe-S cluster assembly ATPase SufC [Lactobacillales bacterium]
MATLEIKNLHVEIEGDEILKGFNLHIKDGEVHAIMGPNGTGKSTLAGVIVGNPKWTITEGEILFNGASILDLPIDERARAGLFLSQQYPAEIPGITTANFIRSAMNARLPEGESVSVMKFIKELDKNLDFLNIPEEMAERYLNVGYSGGEKKRNEILQMLMLKPSFAILDEIDSGLDIDALKVVGKGVNKMRDGQFSALLITHYQRLLDHITPDVIHIMMDGRIVKSGGMELVAELESTGYQAIAQELGIDYKDKD